MNLTKTTFDSGLSNIQDCAAKGRMPGVVYKNVSTGDLSPSIGVAKNSTGANQEA